MILVTIGTGIGGGLILDGRLYHGASGGAGEVGHMLVDPSGRVCGCGRRGCLEAIASGSALDRAARQIATAEPEGSGSSNSPPRGRRRAGRPHPRRGRGSRRRHRAAPRSAPPARTSAPASPTWSTSSTRRSSSSAAACARATIYLETAIDVMQRDAYAQHSSRRPRRRGRARRRSPRYRRRAGRPGPPRAWTSPDA